jgi:diaminobutyrate-2-oxoglutarate transaminase
LPLVPVEGDGARIRDVSGRWFYDCLTSAGAASLGWNHPVVRDAIHTVMSSRAPLLTLDFPTPLRDQFCEELLRSLPPELADDAVIHFCGPSGANAIEAALTAAEIATGNHEHIAFEGGFHGCSRGARSVSTAGGFRRKFGRPEMHTHVLPFPQDYRCPFGVGGSEGIELARCAVERLLFDPQSPLTRPASLILECVQGEGGCIEAPATWLQAVRALTRRARVPFIADEVQTGVCRTGSMWSFENAKVVPDIVVASKGLGSGMPIAVIVMRSELNAWKPGTFTGTFRGSSLAFAVAAAVLKFAREERLADQVRTVGGRVIEGLRQVQKNADCIGDVRGRGLLVGVEIVPVDGPTDARGRRAPAPALARSVQRACFDKGLLVEIGGAHENVVRFLPPLTLTHSEADAVVDIFDQAVRAAQRQRGPE